MYMPNYITLSGVNPIALWFVSFTSSWKPFQSCICRLSSRIHKGFFINTGYHWTKPLFCISRGREKMTTCSFLSTYANKQQRVSSLKCDRQRCVGESQSSSNVVLHLHTTTDELAAGFPPDQILASELPASISAHGSYKQQWNPNTFQLPHA